MASNCSSTHGPGTAASGPGGALGVDIPPRGGAGAPPASLLRSCHSQHRISASVVTYKPQTDRKMARRVRRKGQRMNRVGCAKSNYY